MAGDVDLFGYQKERVGDFIYSSDYASLFFANANTATNTTAGKAGMVQSVSINYQHNVQPRFETGSHSLYWTSGQSIGEVQVGRLVGDAGLLNGIQPGRSPNDLRKGILGHVEAKIGRQGITGIALKQDVLVLSGCVMRGYGLSWSVGGVDIQEGITISAGLVKLGLVSMG